MATYAGSISALELFPRAGSYTSLGPATPVAVRERDRHRQAFLHSERHLQCVWFDPALRPPDLHTSDEERVLVESPGVWDLEAGPDFLGAALRVGAGRRRIEGDVEIHVHPRDWQQHGHAEDPRYSKVRVHVTYFPGDIDRALFPPGTIHIALKDRLQADPFFSFDTIDLTAYPHALRTEHTPCARILASWSPERRTHLLEAAGEERLRRKAERLSTAIHEKGPDQVLYEEILCALGYKHNKVPFRYLAEAVPLELLRKHSAGDRDNAYAILLGVANLLPKRTSKRWDNETRAFVRRLWDTWWKQKELWDSRLLSADRWRLSGLRPANQPIRRLMGAACLFTEEDPLSRRLVDLAAQCPEDFVRSAQALLTGSSDTYWDRRLSLCGKVRATSVALIGPSRASAIIANVLIPFLAALGEDAPFHGGILCRLPAEGDNAIVRQSAHTLFGPDHSAKLYRSGLRRQGLLQIFHDFCLNDRSRCSTCPLPDALRDPPVTTAGRHQS